MDIKVKKRNGRLQEFNVEKINASAQRACESISEVSASEIVLDAQLQLYDKVRSEEIDQALVLSAREKIEKEIQIPIKADFHVRTLFDHSKNLVSKHHHGR